jgi:hypothetical protein
LKAAGILAGSAVGGPLGAVLNQQQKQALGEVLAELHENGVVFYEDQGLLRAPWNARHRELTPSETLEVILAGPPDFRAHLWMRQGPETEQVRSLAHLQEMETFYAQGDPAALDQPCLANALRNLARAGWKMEAGGPKGEARPLGPLGAYRLLGPDGQARSKVELHSPRDRHHYRLQSAEELASFDFFHGTGDEKSVADPVLARRLKEVEEEGLSFNCAAYPGHGAWGAYQSMRAGKDVALALGDVPLRPIRGKTVADLEAALAAAQEPLQVYRATLLPEVEAGRFDKNQLGALVRALQQPVDGLDLKERAELFVELARAVRNGPDKDKDLYTQTRGAILLYNQLVEGGLKGEEFTRALLSTAGLASLVGADQAQEAVQHIAVEIPRESFFPEARQELQDAFLRLVRASRNVEEARRAAAISFIQVGGESHEERLAVLESLMRSTGGQGAIEHYLALLAGRPAGATLQEAAAPYLLLLDGLKAIGKQDEAPRTYTFIRDGLRLGRFPQGSTPTGLAERFLELLLLNKDPETARQGLLPQASGNPGTGKVEEGEREVDVGGVVLPRQEGNRS